MNKPGGWQMADSFAPCNWPEDKAEAKAAFEEANSLLGAKYEALVYCGYQVVAGTNYKFICKQTRSTNPPEQHLCIATVHKPLPGAKEPKATFTDVITFM